MKKAFEIKSNLENLRIVEKVIDEISAELKLAKEAYGKIMVSALEAVNNAIIHGNGSNEEKSVKILIKIEEKIMTISVEDEGEGFIPAGIPDPTKPENIENLRGRGVFLMSKLADNIQFNKKGNLVIMTFKDIET
jgi:serine/threonine-protein kinase RsbW